MINLGKRSTQDPPTLHLLLSLASSPLTDIQFFALASNWGTPNPILIKNLFYSTLSTSIRKQALKLLARHGNQRGVLEALNAPNCPSSWQLTALKCLSNKKAKPHRGWPHRQEIVDRFLLTLKWESTLESRGKFNRWLYLGAFELVSNYISGLDLKQMLVKTAG
jgi:hypothetical protein